MSKHLMPLLKHNVIFFFMILKPTTGVGEPAPFYPYVPAAGKPGSYNCKTEMSG